MCQQRFLLPKVLNVILSDLHIDQEGRQHAASNRTGADVTVHQAMESNVTKGRCFNAGTVLRGPFDMLYN